MVINWFNNCIKGIQMTSSSNPSSAVASDRGHGARIFLFAMGLALATTGGAILSAIGAGDLQHIASTIWLSRDSDIAIEQRRQSATVAILGENLHSLIGEVEALKSRGLSASSAVEDRLARLDSELKQLTTDTGDMWIPKTASTLGQPWHDEVTELRTNLALAGVEIGALRSSLDASQQAQHGQIGDITRRVDRLEQLVGASDVTASIPVTSFRRRPPRSLAGWSVRDAQRGAAIITGHGGTYEVTPGTIVPGIGRVASVRPRGNTWIVVTDKGIIVQH
jgi:hypothetical protein